MPTPTRSPSYSPRRNASVDRPRRLKESPTCIAPRRTSPDKPLGRGSGVQFLNTQRSDLVRVFSF